MPIIPRYQAGGGPRTEGLTYAGAYAPPDGSGWRTLAKATGAADAIVGAARTLFPPQGRKEDPQPPLDPGNDRPGADAPTGGRETSTPLANPGPGADTLAAHEQEIAWRRSWLEADRTDVDPGMVMEARRRMAEGLTGAARTVFDALTEPREGEVAASAMKLDGARNLDRATALSIEREALGVEEFVRFADLDHSHAQAGLSSALAERGRRSLAETGDPDRVASERRALLSEAYSRRIADVLARDPQRADGLLRTQAGVLDEASRERLSAAITEEKARQEARSTVAALAAGQASLADDPQALIEAALQTAGGDPARSRALRGAALGEWMASRARRDAAEDRGWDALAPVLAQTASSGGWTSLDGTLWQSLSDRQREAVRRYTEAPPASSDKLVLGRARTLAAKAPGDFAQLDLTPMQPDLTFSDFLAVRSLRDAARADTPEWRRAQARLAAADDTLETVAAEQGVVLTDALRGDFFQGLDRDQAMNGGWPTPDAIVSLCQKTLKRGGTTRLPTLPWPQNPANPPFDVRISLAPDGKPDFGGLARAYETRNVDPYTVSTGRNDPGGISYGEWQMATNSKTPTTFLQSPEGARWADRFREPGNKRLYRPGTPEFGKAWVDTTAADEAGFRRDQAAFMRRHYYQRQVDRIKAETGLDLSKRSYALQAVIFSTAVREGEYSPFLSNVIKDLRATDGRELGDFSDRPDNGGIGDQIIIGAIYDGRTPTDFLKKNGKWDPIAERMQRERASAFNLFDTDPKRDMADLFPPPSRRGPPIK